MGDRAKLRQRVLKSGKIIYNNGAIIVDCTIRNISADTGAQLQIPLTVPIPDRFDFCETMTSKRRPAMVIWRRVDCIGVRLDELDGPLTTLPRSH